MDLLHFQGGCTKVTATDYPRIRNQSADIRYIIILVIYKIIIKLFFCLLENVFDLLIVPVAFFYLLSFVAHMTIRTANKIHVYRLGYIQYETALAMHILWDRWINIYEMLGIDE